ncbi:MAG: VCBS repeat-containing protein [Bryobacteraceae bacterium]
MPLGSFNRWMRPFCAAAILTAAAHAATHTVSFNAPKVYPAGPDPYSVAIGDFNHDGKPDLAVALGASNDVAILLGNGNGTFQPPVTYAVGSTPDFVAVGDFNGDGKLDLVVANSASNSISILLGNGDGTFLQAAFYAVDKAPSSVAVGDFNGDGKLDLAVTDAGSIGLPRVYGHTISILLGNGDGTFQPQTSYEVGSKPMSVAVGDLNGDGKPDLVVACEHGWVVSILLGKGDGTFQAAVDYAAGQSPLSVALGDFNGDGKLDLALANGVSKDDLAFTIVLGNGDGTFQPAVGYMLAGGLEYAVSLAVGDFNGDHKLDLAVGGINSRSDSEPYNVSILLGNGDGTFQAAETYFVGASPVSIAVGDLNGDGSPDLAATGFYAASVTIMLDKADGTLQSTVDYTLPGSGNSVAVGDFNGDGKPDLAMNGYGVLILLNNGDGTFGPPVSYPAGDGGVAVGDFNGDGKLDLAVTDFGDGLTNPGDTVSILLGNGDGTFQPGVSYVVPFAPAAVAVADFNGDGKLDLAVASQLFDCCFPGAVAVLLGNGDGTFQPAVTYDVGVGPSSVAVGDFNGDGKPDLAVTNMGSDPGNISVLLNHGDGTFEPQVTYAVGSNPASVAVGDFNGDGKLDLAVANSASDWVSILPGNGNGTFQTPVNAEVGSGSGFVIAGDFNGDGNLDLAITSGTGVSILAGTGAGAFQPPVGFAAGYVPVALAAGDFNQDGKPDLAVANSRSSNVSVLTNTTR